VERLKRRSLGKKLCELRAGWCFQANYSLQSYLDKPIGQQSPMLLGGVERAVTNVIRVVVFEVYEIQASARFLDLSESANPTECF